MQLNPSRQACTCRSWRPIPGSRSLESLLLLLPLVLPVPQNGGAGDLNGVEYGVGFQLLLETTVLAPLKILFLLSHRLFGSKIEPSISLTGSVKEGRPLPPPPPTGQREWTRRTQYSSKNKIGGVDPAVTCSEDEDTIEEEESMDSRPTSSEDGDNEYTGTRPALSEDDRQ